MAPVAWNVDQSELLELQRSHIEEWVSGECEFHAVDGRYYASPIRLTRVLVSALAEVENAYLAGVEKGVVFSGSVDVDVVERLAVLQLKLSTLHETSLRNSLSPLSTFCDMFNIRRLVAVLRCLREVHGLGTYIEIPNESKLRELARTPESYCQCPPANRTTISLRRRDSPTRV